ncbi:lytic transglycosylase domain-containing protein [Sphingorhabdus pulchriflava]|uniref:lytic transglycosylase domain-containing protein n=1 Tax=Sphingorhabdus pulchriflava TaxID=2292257 RepID=UPI001EF127B4|nr:lytic transglycosylase domain-containing protein [Sphingorhabdus pulchriflava]
MASPAWAGTADTVRQAVAPDALEQIGGQPSAKDKQSFSAIFAAIDGKSWSEASKLIDAAPKGPLAHIARAELYLAAGSPKVEASQLQSLLNDAPWLPQAERLEKMASKRGASDLPIRPGTKRFSFLGSAPKRDLPDASPAAATLRDKLQVEIKADNPSGAESLLEAQASSLDIRALTELRYRVAWSYYIENDDANARRVAGVARAAGGEWGTQAEWVHALADWRLGDHKEAFASFDRVSRATDNEELKAAALFWSSRAAVAARQPQQVQPRLQAAARMQETFYGLLAAEALGMEPVASKTVRRTAPDWKQVTGTDNVRAAIALSAIGKNELADEALRHQARIGDERQHAALARLAGALNLPATQLWMGHYGPRGENLDPMARYPLPSWQPSGGWRIDPALVYAHTLQESAFRTSVISGAGARGLMQVKPTTAQEMARARGAYLSASDLDRPAVNLEYGQSYIEKLRDLNATGGLLPKVIAAYNAGPAPVTRWNNEIRDNGDPLLFIESIPYWETRGYVAIILRNYWMYEIQSGKNGGSMKGLAQYLWPTVPNQGRVSTVRMVRTSSHGGSIAAR